MNSNINNLWNSNDSKIWEKYLHKYYDAVMPNHVEIEKEMESLDINILKDMSEFEFYKFLYENYSESELKFLHNFFIKVNKFQNEELAKK